MFPAQDGEWIGVHARITDIFFDNTGLILGGGAAVEHGPDVHVKPVQHRAKDDNDGEELRDKAQEIPNIKNNVINNLEKDLEKEEVMISTLYCCRKFLIFHSPIFYSEREGQT